MKSMAEPASLAKAAVLAVTVLLAGCDGLLRSGESVGYCPTVEPYAREIAEDRDAKLIRYASAAAVLQALRLERIDVAVIGRLAFPGEYPAAGRRLEQGYTLIGPAAVMVPYDSVVARAIATALPAEIVETNFPEFAQVVFFESAEQALASGAPVLIDWDDWQDGFQLVTPLYPDGRKVEKFRTPVVFERKRSR